LEEGREPALEVAKEEVAPTKSSQKSGSSVNSTTLYSTLFVCFYGGRAEI
jgi:hypothetical protein